MNIREARQLCHAKEALKYLLKASDVLERADKYNSCSDDFKHFKNKVDEIISCDNGEAGLKRFIDLIRLKNN